MSWIIGKLGRHVSRDEVARLASLHPTPLHRTTTDVFYVAAGGLAETCHYGGNGASGWVSVGTALAPDGPGVRPLASADWAAHLARPEPDFAGLDGHFAAVRWSAGRVDAFTDALGLRSLYVGQVPDGIVFSTRLDWVARLSGQAEIDLEVFGGHWLAFNQMSTRSLVAGIDRLGPGGTARCTLAGIDRTEAPWAPGRGEPDPIGRLEQALRPALGPGARLSLGLSGGLDSRLLLGLLAQAGTPFALHVFGDPDEADVRISRRIAAGGGWPQVLLAAELPPVDTALGLLEAHAGPTCASTPASAAVKLSVYGALHADCRLVVDGGFGEVARRQFFNRLYRRGGRDLARGRAQALLPHVRAVRARIFTADVEAQMQRGLAAEIDRLLATMPPPDEVGLAGFLDLVAVRTRLPNFYGYGQAHLDEQVVNYMPFAQPSFLSAALAAPVRDRINGRLFRRTLRRRAPALTRYPLVKGDTTYPFHLPPVPAYAWTWLKQRLGGGREGSPRDAFLERLADPVRDLVRSADTRAFPLYDHARLQALVDRYYAGETALGAEVDWWLSFEVWRRGLAGLRIV